MWELLAVEGLRQAAATQGNTCAACPQGSGRGRLAHDAALPHGADQRPETPRNLGASFRTRVLNLAKARGRLLEVLLARYALERLLLRWYIGSSLNTSALLSCRSSGEERIPMRGDRRRELDCNPYDIQECHVYMTYCGSSGNAAAARDERAPMSLFPPNHVEHLSMSEPAHALPSETLFTRARGGIALDALGRPREPERLEAPCRHSSGPAWATRCRGRLDAMHLASDRQGEFSGERALAAGTAARPVADPASCRVPDERLGFVPVCEAEAELTFCTARHGAPHAQAIC